LQGGHAHNALDEGRINTVFNLLALDGVEVGTIHLVGDLLCIFRGDDAGRLLHDFLQAFHAYVDNPAADRAALGSDEFLKHSLRCSGSGCGVCYRFRCPLDGLPQHGLGDARGF